VLEGYFSPAKSRAFTRIERVLARRTDALVAVSDEVRDDLVRLGVAPPGKFTVIPLGFDLSPFAATPAERAAARAEVRAELGLGEAPVVLLVARLVPIKRVDRFLRIARRVAEERPDARFVVVGDGEAGAALRASDDARALGGSVVWAGLRGDVPRFVHAADVVALTSDNEGTPVSLIEAQAAGAPVVATAVGGVRATVLDGVSARLVAPEDEEGFARTTLELLADPAGAAAMGAAGVEHALGGFGLEALVDRVDALYRSLL
jgi:glycosyltransferase involved in cell wall biosynthesis